MTTSTKKTNTGSFSEEQSVYIKLAKQKLNERYGRAPKAFVHTYGCQQNVSDSERLKGLLFEMGYTMCETVEEADFVLYNTCAVREHAEDRVWGNIGVLKKQKQLRPDMIIAVCGCMMQQSANANRVKRSYPYVDIVFGTFCRHKLPQFIYERISGKGRIFEISESDNDIIEGQPVLRDGEFKAWVPIMYGCNNFCTYCIVPYVRGRERSRKPDEIVAEVEGLVKDGYKEITLLGQNVNSYGKGLEDGINFAQLLRRIDKTEGDFRIRFMTSHPKDCTEELLEVMASSQKICRHLHLPVQSGSDRILKAMNRHYDKKAYMHLIDTARKLMPDITFSSDIIVGFPGETYEDFLQTAELIKQVKYANLFTFIYSPRNGTPAAALPDPVSRKEKGEWFSQLLKEQELIGDEIAKSIIGKTVRMLCEDVGRSPDTLLGRTFNNAVVEFFGDESLIGEFATVKVTGYSSYLVGEIIK